MWMLVKVDYRISRGSRVAEIDTHGAPRGFSAQPGAIRTPYHSDCLTPWRQLRKLAALRDQAA
jgi:hypothetical protein